MKKIFTLIVVLFVVVAVKAQQPGNLDNSFGNNGIVSTAIGDDNFIVDCVEELCIQPDGKIIAVGSSRKASIKRFAFVRYNSDGSLDNDFANQGILVYDPYNIYGNFVMDVDVLEDGKIIACARFYNNIISRPVFIKLNSDGSFDNSFGENGMKEFDFNPISVLPIKLLLQADGKMIVAGCYNDQVMTMRFNEDASIDASYGENGFCIFSEISNKSSIESAVMQEDGKVLIAGFTSPDTYVQKMLVARVNTDGSPDATFGENGYKIIDLGEGNDYATSIALQSDGKIILGGHSWEANAPALIYKFAVLRLNSNATIDTSFADDGYFYSKIEENAENYIDDILVSPAGNIYAAFNTANHSTLVYDMGIFCLKTDGNLNEEFGNAGYKSININGGTNIAKALARQSDGKLILAGETYRDNSTGETFGLARFIPIHEEPVAVEETQYSSLKVYPNPANDILNIISEENNNIEIINVLGEVVFQTNKSGIINVNISNWNAGVYFIRIQNELSIKVEKIVKE